MVKLRVQAWSISATSLDLSGFGIVGWSRKICACISLRCDVPGLYISKIGLSILQWRRCLATLELCPSIHNS